MRPSGGGGGSLAWRVAQRHRGSLNKTKLPTDFSWLGKLKSMIDIKDQGACGSCWAIGAVSVLNAHAELYDLPRRFSTQQIVSCTPNPMECGGKGGCDGATAELAMQHVLQADLLSEDEFPYAAHDLACPRSVKEKMGTMLIQGATTSFGMHGYKTLPQNKVKPLLHAVYNQGPVAVSMAATSGFSWYTSGIYSNCNSWIVNHLVTLIGFGQASSTNKYFVIQNSWGNYWGENGLMKIIRLDNKAEDKNCGWDLKPEDGIGCKGGPSKVWVCGSCGITFDSVVPNFKLKKTGWWATSAGRKPDM